jgi:AAA+ superfamily predicted ATPase
MVKRMSNNQNTSLGSDMDWFCRYTDARVKLYLGIECAVRSMDEFTAPPIVDDGSAYAMMMEQYHFSLHERIVFLLALATTLKPDALDIFFIKDKNYDKEFSAFGGRFDPSHTVFQPTVQTALFLIAGDDITLRAKYCGMFEREHVFHKENILRINRSREDEPPLQGTIALSQETLTQVTTGHTLVPEHGNDFPARRVETERDFDELVLEPSAKKRLNEILLWICHGAALNEKWGLRKYILPGYRVLFYGPPGTGKTFAATALGKKAQKPVYRIDLSLVVSKYIGETEKNISRVFDAAEHRDWILFFDEADALFAKRTQVSSSHDRFANQEVAYLLQRIEQYNGMAILATNMKDNIDEAFMRRFQTVVQFSMPRPQQRQMLWEQVFPKYKPAGDVIQRIAEKYEMSGGSITNVARYASLLAIERMSKMNSDAPDIQEQDLIEGIRLEMMKEGRTL